MLEELIKLVSLYDIDDIDKIKKAYSFAEHYHEGQFRESGEAYINHPLSVAIILAEMHADTETLCAALLHDILEDTNVTKEELEENFGSEIANLVDGVTKLAKMNFSSKEEQNLANTRKIITSIAEDVRIVIIKLADRLHNMRTLQYKKPFKQKENSLETLEIFVPIAYHIGAYRIKSELEDLSLHYLYPEKYKEIEEIKNNIEINSKHCLDEMVYTINDTLEKERIMHEIKVRTKNIYGIYKRLESGYNLSNIHDLLSLKIMVDTISNCYQTLGLIHSKYKPINERFKDYIYNPKTNMYRSLHTTVFGEDERLVQTQIRTFDMDKIASFGLTTYWYINNKDARFIMQKELKEKYQFYKSLLEINKVFGDNKEFLRQIKSELFTDKIYVYTPKGDIIELPKGSTVIDFAYKIHTHLGNTLINALVNDKLVNPFHKLENKDRVKVITNDLSKPKEEWIDAVVTAKAKRKIKTNLQ